MAEPPSDGRIYAGVRRFGGGVLVGVVAVLAVIDAISPAFAIDPIVLGIITGTAAAMLGVKVSLPK